MKRLLPPVMVAILCSVCGSGGSPAFDIPPFLVPSPLLVVRRWRTTGRCSGRLAAGHAQGHLSRLLVARW